MLNIKLIMKVSQKLKWRTKMKKLLLLSLALVSMGNMWAPTKKIKKNLQKSLKLNQKLLKVRKETASLIAGTKPENKDYRAVNKIKNHIDFSINHNKQAGQHTSSALKILTKETE
jgi:hypothetical protein